MAPLRRTALGVFAFGVLLLIVGFVVDTLLLGYAFWLCFLAGVALLVAANLRESKHGRDLG